jgi:hypothetical protein
MDPDEYLNPPDCWALDARDMSDAELSDAMDDLEDRDPRAFSRLQFRLIHSGLI